MPKFIVVHTLSMTERQMAARVRKITSKLPKGYRWKISYCSSGDHKFFCEWEAPSKEALEKGFKDNNLLYENIYPVRVFKVAPVKRNKTQGILP